MKNVIFLILFSGFCSCASKENRPSEKVVGYFDCEKLKLTDNILTIESSVGSTIKNFVLNFGVNSSIIFNDFPAVTDASRKPYETSNTLRSKSPNVILQMKNRLFSGSKNFKFYPEISPEICAKRTALPVIGQYGYDFFCKNHKALHLDFDSLTLCSLRPIDEQEFVGKGGYKEIKSHFTNEGLRIFFIIKRKEYDFTFDTGYKHAFSMPFMDEFPFKDSPEVVEKLGAENGEVHYYNNKSISFGGTYYSSGILLSANARQRVGMGFIKGFNWIIDIDHKKVYIKKNTLGIDTENPFTKQYLSEVRAGRLLIDERNSKAKTFHVGSEIISVNGQKITTENICDIKEWLNKEEDWDKLEIGIREAMP